MKDANVVSSQGFRINSAEGGRLNFSDSSIVQLGVKPIMVTAVPLVHGL